MGEAYFNLKLKLEELGYNNKLPVDAVPLVECILADLLQTTRSLQHYMELSKEALVQRDSLMLEAEPYRCENAKLIQENNHLNREVMELKEENQRITKDSKRKIKSLSEELTKKDALITKLQHDRRDLSLRGICADTQSSRNRSRRKDAGDTAASRLCVCNEPKVDKDITELTRKIYSLEENNESLCDEIILLKDQIEHRENEIIRLNILLEGGRPPTAIAKDCCKGSLDFKLQDLLKQLHDIESTNNILKKEIDNGLEKQHEAMLRALNLAEKNKNLQEEIQKVDALALKVEEDCNKRLADMTKEMRVLQTRIESLTLKNSELEKQLLHKNLQNDSMKIQKIQEALNNAIKERDALQQEVKDLVYNYECLKDKISSWSKDNSVLQKYDATNTKHKNVQVCTSKDELQTLFEKERQNYEKHMMDIQAKLNETVSLFSKHLSRCKEIDVTPKNNMTHNSTFIRDLHKKLCESEQKILMLKKENDEYKNQMSKYEHNNQQNFKDIISQLNAENAELLKENISLSQQLSQYKNSANKDRGDYFKNDVQRFKDEIDKLTQEVKILRNDKQEYHFRYKEALDLVDKLKRDLAYKHKEIEQLQEENSSYKMTSRTGKASADHLKDECNFLREQIKRMQTDVIKEKTLSSQIKNIQLETERSSNEIQNELITIQKKLYLSKDTNDTLERKCKDLQSEILSLKNDKTNLIENIRKLDQERDRLVIDLDHKTENLNVHEQKVKSQTFHISKLENEIIELKRMLNISKVSEHKVADYEGQIAFLNSEITRLTQKFDSAVIENKHLQNSLADANGTLKIIKIEYEKSRKDVEGLKEQLQHYVAEIRRIEEMLSQKEAERSDMLEHFASLSVEANILENTNHSLESESASKTMQLQSYINKIESLESKLLEKENMIDNQSARISSMTCKITSLENEIKLITEEKAILEQNVSYLKKMCSNLQSEHSNLTVGMGDTESELKLYENRIKSLANAKATLEIEKEQLQDKLLTTEKLLSNSRREIVELKLALQDATSETKLLQNRIGRLSRRETEVHEVF